MSSSALTNKSYRMLKKLKRKTMSEEKITKSGKGILDELLQAEYIESDFVSQTTSSSYEESIYCISDKGRAYLEERHRDFLRWCIPTIISTFALVLSYCSYQAATTPLHVKVVDTVYTATASNLPKSTCTNAEP